MLRAAAAASSRATACVFSLNPLSVCLSPLAAPSLIFCCILPTNPESGTPGISSSAAPPPPSLGCLILTLCPLLGISFGIRLSATSSGLALSTGSFAGLLPATCCALVSVCAGSTVRPVCLPKSTLPFAASCSAVIRSKFACVCAFPLISLPKSLS